MDQFDIRDKKWLEGFKELKRIYMMNDARMMQKKLKEVAMTKFRDGGMDAANWNQLKGVWYEGDVDYNNYTVDQIKRAIMAFIGSMKYNYPKLLSKI